MMKSYKAKQCTNVRVTVSSHTETMDPSPKSNSLFSKYPNFMRTYLLLVATQLFLVVGCQGFGGYGI